MVCTCCGGSPNVQIIACDFTGQSQHIFILILEFSEVTDPAVGSKHGDITQVGIWHIIGPYYYKIPEQLHASPKSDSYLFSLKMKTKINEKPKIYYPYCISNILTKSLEKKREFTLTH